MGRNKFFIDTKGFVELARRFDKIGNNVEKVVIEALEDAGETVGDDTVDALDKANLPALGKYSRVNTLTTVLRHPKAIVKGFDIEIGMGFDKTKNGAGTLLITGTPRMQPDKELERMFARKKYSAEINAQISESIQDLIADEMDG